MSFKKLFLSIIICFSISGSSLSQSWDWKWSVQNTQKDAATWSDILDVGYEDEIYTGTMFGDSIFFEDTVFTHESYYDWANWAIAKYDEHGTFLAAFDITSNPGNNIWEVSMVTDQNQNMYIACQFQILANLLDTAIYGRDVVFPESPELFIAKVNPNLKLEWAHLVSSQSQDVCQGLALSPDNYLYMAAKHRGNAGENDTVNYMDQDTAVFTTTLCSILKIDLDGTLIWRNEMTSANYGLEVREMNITHANVILINGHVRDNFYYADDTVVHPHPGEYLHRPYFLKIDPFGQLIEGKIPDWKMIVSDTDLDASGNILFAGFVEDTVVFGSDTIIQHEDTSVNILAKLNPEYEPIWHETAKARKSQGSYYFSIDMSLDTLFFAGRCRGTFSMFDTVFNLGSPYKGLIGQVTPDGDLVNNIVAESSGGLRPNGIRLDNCGNSLVMSGRFAGHAYLGQDTVQSYSNGEWDGLVSKLYLHQPYHFDFGPDTAVCDGIRLTGPEGYNYYYWNGESSTQNWMDVIESGTYTFACTEDYRCWLRDTIKIDVQPGFTIDLGNDTVIGLTDTLHLSVADGYESYLWSTGSTESSVVILASEMGQGNWSVWVEVKQDLCTYTDTIQLSVSSVNELQEMGVQIYPNPAGNMLQVVSERKFEKIEIISNKGVIIASIRFQDARDGRVSFDLSNIPEGIYFIKIVFTGYVGCGKIIKL